MYIRLQESQHSLDVGIFNPTYAKLISDWRVREFHPKSMKQTPDPALHSNSPNHWRTVADIHTYCE